SLRVDLHERKRVPLVAADVELGVHQAGARYRQAEEGERVTERRECLVPDRGVRQLHHQAEGLERLLTADRRTRRRIEALQPVGVEGGDRVGVSGRDGGIDAGDGRRGSVRSYAAPWRLCGPQRSWDARRIARELIEARERVVLTIGGEELVVSREPVR